MGPYIVGAAIWGLLAPPAAADRHRPFESFYSFEEEADQALKHFPWFGNAEAVRANVRAWKGLCGDQQLNLNTPVVSGLGVSYKNMLDIFTVIENHFRRNKSAHFEGLRPADVERTSGLRRGVLPFVLRQITAPGKTENPYTSCPVLVMSSLTVTALWNASLSLDSWAEADRTVAQLAAARAIYALMMQEPKWKFVNADTYQGWFIPSHTRDFVRRRLLCSLNQFDIGMSDACKQTVRGLRQAVREMMGEEADDFLLCGGGGMHGGSMGAFQSLIESAGSQGGSTYCEVGFNYGLSSAVALCLPGVQVLSWDLASDTEYTEAPVTAFAAGYLRAKFPDRFRITFGDSRATLPRAGKVLGRRLCDSVFVDGSHDPEIAKEDLLNFMNVSAPGAVFILDDCWQAENGQREVADWAAASFRFDWDSLSTADGHCVLRRRWAASESPLRREAPSSESGSQP